MTVTTTNSRHVLFKLDGGRLPEDVLGRLRDEIVVAGWLRANGTLEDVELRVGGATRKVTGTLHAVSIEGSIGLANGDVTCGLRAVLARETDTGHETLSGEIVAARITALEGLAIAFDDVTATRKNGFLDTMSVTAAPSSPALAAPPAPAPAIAPAAAPPPPAPPSAPSVPPPAPAPSEPVVEKPRPSPTFSAPVALPMKPVKPTVVEEEQVYPDAGDVVEHFAFGRCEVVKSDGDRLHIRLGKDGRIKEVALEMLKVTPLPPVEGASGKHFKLDRRM
ncbi:MAG: hypothetical protein U0270_35945 [Labilithrix sp.]